MAQEIRLYTTEKLDTGIEIIFPVAQSHYLAVVMRAKTGEFVSLFNGKDGQWQVEISSVAKKLVTATVIKQTRPQISSPDLWLAFAPLKNKTELVVEKAVELGVSKIIPVVTRHSVVRSVNMEKLTAHLIEASEQCERLDIPTIETYKDLSYLLGDWEKDRILLYGDESGGGVSLPKLLSKLPKQGKYGVLIGAEGGFSGDEFNMLKACAFTKGFGMGARIMRADTAAVAALACVQSQLGDWDLNPHFIN